MLKGDSPTNKVKVEMPLEPQKTTSTVIPSKEKCHRNLLESAYALIILSIALITAVIVGLLIPPFFLVLIFLVPFLLYNSIKFPYYYHKENEMRTQHGIT